MPRGNWIRVLLCGLVAGVVWFLLSAVLLALFGRGLLGAIERGQPYPAQGGLYFLTIDLMMGVWAIWLYAAISPRYGVGPKTAAISGLAWWVIKSLQSAKWVGLGVVPQEVVLAPLATTLVAIVVATLVGAWCYERAEASARSALRHQPE